MCEPGSGAKDEPMGQVRELGQSDDPNSENVGVWCQMCIKTKCSDLQISQIFIYKHIKCLNYGIVAFFKEILSNFVFDGSNIAQIIWEMSNKRLYTFT